MCSQNIWTEKKIQMIFTWLGRSQNFENRLRVVCDNIQWLVIIHSGYISGIYLYKQISHILLARCKLVTAFGENIWVVFSKFKMHGFSCPRNFIGILPRIRDLVFRTSINDTYERASMLYAGKMKKYIMQMLQVCVI